MIRKQLFSFFAGVLLIALSSIAQAATTTDFNAAMQALEDDFSDTATWINTQLAKSTAFAAGGAVQRPAAVKVLPGFELGITGGLDVAVDPEKITDIDTYAISSDFLSFPPLFFTQTAMIHGKIGLFRIPHVGKLDVGIGALSYNVNIDRKLQGHFSQWQAEARIQPDLTLPFDLSLAVGVGNIKGNYTLSHTHTEEIGSIDYNGSTYTQNLDTTVYMSSDWDVTAYYAKFVISRSLLLVTPYVGIGIQTAAGKVNTVVGARGTLRLDADELDNMSVQGPTSTDPNKFDFRFLGGIQVTVLPIMSINLSGEYGHNVYAVSLGFILGIF